MNHYCSPWCDDWDECNELGLLKVMTIVTEHPDRVTKDWCRNLKYQSLQNIGEESQEE